MGDVPSLKGFEEPKKSEPATGKIVAWVLGGIAVIFLFSWLASGEDVSFSGELVDFNVIDEANLQVVIAFTNEGDEPAKGECTVEAHDSSRVVGYDILSTTENVSPGQTEEYHGAIRIEDEGAFRVVDVTVTDCEEN